MKIRRDTLGFGRQFFFPLFFFILIFAFVWLGFSSMGEQNGEEQLLSVENAILRNAVQCYAIEGKYPESLEYLAANYPVVVDRERFVYHYQYLGDNMIPEIQVFSR